MGHNRSSLNCQRPPRRRASSVAPEHAAFYCAEALNGLGAKSQDFRLRLAEAALVRQIYKFMLERRSESHAAKM